MNRTLRLVKHPQLVGSVSVTSIVLLVSSIRLYWRRTRNWSSV
jgi:uncharacterized iron-regulated membrane protein